MFNEAGESEMLNGCWKCGGTAIVGYIEASGDEAIRDQINLHMWTGVNLLVIGRGFQLHMGEPDGKPGAIIKAGAVLKLKMQMWFSGISCISASCNLFSP